MEHSQIILNMLASKNISAYRLAKETGISESLFSKWKSKPTSEISSSNLARIADYLDSVSYTHLDVYKRQGRRRIHNGRAPLIAHKFKKIIGLFLVCLLPVLFPAVPGVLAVHAYGLAIVVNL